MTKQPLHTWIGWIGTLVAIVDYGLFAADILPEIWFFGIGSGASLLLVWAFYKDRAHYGAVLQAVFIVLNMIGIMQNLLS